MPRVAVLTGLVVLAVVALAGGGGCHPADPTVVRIVSSLPRTGSVRSQSDAIVRGIRMAIEEVDGRIGAFRVEYLDLDDSNAATGLWTSEAEAANARRALQDPDVVGYIGTLNSGSAKVSMPILNRGDLLMVSPATTAVGLTKPELGEPGEPEIYRPSGRRNFVRVIPADDLQGPRAADWAAKRGVRRVCVLDDGDAYGKGIADLFAERCRELGIEVLSQDSLDPRAAEFRSLMATVASRRPEMVYFGGTTQSKGGQVAKDLVAAGIDAPLLVPDGCLETAFLEAAGPELLEGRCFVTFGGLPPERLTGRGRAFVDRYRERYGESPEAFAIYGYEAAHVVLHALRSVGRKDRRAITDAALAIRDFDGALGRWSFDDNGDTTLSALTILAVRDGGFVFEETITADVAATADAAADDARP
jgi:branched-chain amino acid transport system substrate-binding protein